MRKAKLVALATSVLAAVVMLAVTPTKVRAIEPACVNACTPALTAALQACKGDRTCISNAWVAFQACVKQSCQ
jgi:hypothetical protein